MADQTQGAPGARPHRQLGADKPKHGGAVHRATSECLRVADADKPQAARKISSFQITSVTVGSRASADAGEDSADDLDESHTDDISRITDLENETPSFSEDTFSKDEVFYNASSASLGCAPVIPTSSQYGLAIVGPDGQAQHHPSADVGDARIGVALADAGSGAAADAGAPKPSEGAREGHEQVRNERFKVVKIESTEPFRRGRWTCMDYLDHTTAPPTAPTAGGVDCQPDPAAPDAGSAAADAQQDDQAPPDAPAKQAAKELQAPEAAAHAFPAASPGQSLTQPVMLAAAAQSPPMELPQQQQMAQAPAPAPQQHAQSVSHVSLGASPHPQQQPQPAQIPQSFPSHQLQQAIAQAQGMPQMQQMQMHPQLPNQQMQQIQSQQIQNQQIQNQQIQNQQIQNQQIQNQQIQNQQMQNQQAQIQQLQGQQHLGHGQSQMTNMQQMPQMQQLQPQGQMQQMSGQQAQIQHMQMQQMPGQQMPGQQMPGQQMANQQMANQQMTNQQMTNQQMTNQQMTNQQMTNQQMSNQQQISNQQVSGQQPLHQMHPQQPQMQTIPQQPHHIQAQQPQLQHMQNQQQLHPMQGGQQHQMQAGQAHQQHQMQPHMQQMSQMGGQGQTMPQLHQTGAPQGPMHGQMQQPGIGGYGGQQVAQSPNPQAMMQPTPQHLGQQAQAPQPIVQAQHGVPQFYQQAQLAQQGQSLPQDAMAGVVGSQLPNGLQGGQTQGATLPSTLQGIGALQMMTQPPQSVPMIDGGQPGMQMPVADPMYMQAPNVQQQLPPMMSQQTAPQPGQGQQAHLATQMTMSHQMPNQQHAIPNQQHAIPGQQHPQIPGQTAVVNQSSMQSVPVQQMPQVSMASVVQQNPQPMMQSIVGNQQGVPMQAPSVHGVPASVVQSQANMHGQVSVPMGGFAGVPGSMQQSSLPSMTQTNMTAQIGMQNPVNGQLDMGMGQQTVCPPPAVGQPMMSGTNSPVVPLPVGSSIGYAQNPAGANPADGQNFGSPVGAAAAHSTGGLVGGSVGLPGGEATESGGGTPASDGTQIDNNEGKDDLQIGQSSEDSESLSGLAMALGGTSNATSRPPSRAASPPCTHPAETHHHSASGTSAVAIDNKIEQAMDLVKSHLMFAVREEVEVLKEKIAELMEKINQLEIENSVLRAHATQETLAQLAAPPPATSPPAGPVS